MALPSLSNSQLPINMDRVNILIVEDRLEDSDELKRVLTQYHYQVVGVATSLKEALVMFYESQVDLVIIDIYLGSVPDGIAFAETLNTTPGAARPFVFLTGSTDRKTFERAKLTHPFSYLIKPFNELEVLYAIEMAVERFYQQRETFHQETTDTVVGKEYLFIKKGRSLKKVWLRDILYIEVEERYCHVITAKEKYLVMLSLKKMLSLLGDQFVQTHRKYLVNLEQIEEILTTDHEIKIAGDHMVPISEKYREVLKKLRTLK